MDNHSLIEVAHMLYRVRLTIVDGESWLMEPPKKFYPFNPACEGWLGFAHSVISQASTSRAFVSTIMVVFLLIWERLTRRSP